jgi:shikimate kinase/3-dehydroquinate synthase
MTAPRIWLSGPMGSGKSSVAPLVAAALGVPAYDLDAEIEARAGASVAAIFASRGEAGFRAIEQATCAALLAETNATGAVVALGGGAVTSLELRRVLLRTGVLVTLEATPGALGARIRDAETRPLLAGREPSVVLAELRDARADAYAECHGVVDTTALAPHEVAERVLALAARPSIVVPLGSRTYRVDLGRGIRHTLAERLRACVSGACVLVVDSALQARWGDETLHELSRAGIATVSVELRGGDAEKNLAAVERIWDAALRAGVDREAMVVALGGGVVGDVAGFAASTLLRGVSFAQVPSTLLAMVDSSVGGKTGIDRPEGKNLVGTVHQPRFVLCDVELLETLPIAERRAGLAEVVKCALISGEDALAQIEHDADALARGDADATLRAIRMSVGVKADIVAADEHETRGLRVKLNLGHTVGHAIEAQSNYTVRHGESVGLGLLAALRVSEGLGLASAGLARRVSSLLAVFALPTDLGAHISADLWRWLQADKKRSGGAVRFLVPVTPGDVRVVPIAPSDIARLVQS